MWVETGSSPNSRSWWQLWQTRPTRPSSMSKSAACTLRPQWSQFRPVTRMVMRPSLAMLGLGRSLLTVLPPLLRSSLTWLRRKHGLGVGASILPVVQRDDAVVVLSGWVQGGNRSSVGGCRASNSASWPRADATAASMVPRWLAAKPRCKIANHHSLSPIVCRLRFPLRNRHRQRWRKAQTGGITMARRQKKAGWIEGLKQFFHRFWSE
jgi:hypothetical protein